MKARVSKYFGDKDTITNFDFFTSYAPVGTRFRVVTRLTPQVAVVTRF